MFTDKGSVLTTGAGSSCPQDIRRRSGLANVASDGAATLVASTIARSSGANPPTWAMKPTTLAVPTSQRRRHLQLECQGSRADGISDYPKIVTIRQRHP